MRVLLLPPLVWKGVGRENDFQIQAQRGLRTCDQGMQPTQGDSEGESELRD